MEKSILPALLMSAIASSTDATAIAFLIPLAQSVLFKALLKAGIED